MIVRIINVKLTEEGFVVAYQPVGVPEVRRTLFKPAAMPGGHELVRAGVLVDMVFDHGQVAYCCRPQQRVAVASIHAIRCA